MSVSGASSEYTQELIAFSVDQLFPSPLPTSVPRSGLLDVFGNKLLDTLAHMFALPVPPNINQDVSLPRS